MTSVQFILLIVTFCRHLVPINVLKFTAVLFNSSEFTSDLFKLLLKTDDIKKLSLVKKKNLF